MPRLFAAVALAAALLGTSAAPGSAQSPSAPGQTAPTEQVRPHEFPPPYLGEAEAPETKAILPPPPGPDTALGRADAAAFADTRALQGSARWDLAINDAKQAPDALMADFACALGARVDRAAAPALYGLLGRMRGDVVRAVNAAKDHFDRRRPFLGGDAPICVPRTHNLETSGSYPSGHATLGYATALVLAQAAPDRVAPVLRRGRIYGESRVVCGVHWASDVAAGIVNASAVVAALNANAGFRADFERARAEIAGVRSAASGAVAPEAPACAREDEAAAHPPR